MFAFGEPPDFGVQQAARTRSGASTSRPEQRDQPERQPAPRLTVRGGAPRSRATAKFTARPHSISRGRSRPRRARGRHRRERRAHRRFLYSARLRLSRAIRGTAWALVAAGVARSGAPAPARASPGGRCWRAAAAAPAALCVAVPRTKARDVAVCALQMWAYLAAYEMPNDDPQRLRDRVSTSSIRSRSTACSGFGRPPTQRLQRAFAAPGRSTASSACSPGATGCGSRCRT